ncbi:secretion protein HylD [Erythrobacter sp. SG61-1L]|uniref:efflux RND transporter periplasmic adaptor subunit n=1 Tax=Erythrobacter sp. SG61-1L TaxID=1603897 RepID=UPI0006C8EAC1|nr:efflux RND transporter periplasmic adaptor subunit [Erythrobacter sp. SG61-1L]KPL66802.1 secretion protein HylD [Erythrobacter sp. SG61-1L]
MNELTSIELHDGRDSVLPGVLNSGRGRLIAIIALIAALIGAWFLFAGAGQDAPPAAPSTVTVSVPLQREITEWDEFVGRFEASKAVEIRPRVSGAVTAVHFRDGQIVRKGQPLFTIDPRPFTAALREAQADVSAANSELALARADLERANRLVEFDGVSKSEIDRLRARERAASATLAAAQARVNSRALDVEFATVRAPMTGRISDRRVDPGNLVSAGDGGSGTLLTTLMAVDPIYFSFEGSEALYLKAKRNGAGEGLPVAVRLQDESDYVHQGRLDFTDNGLDPRSGTIRARATFDNPDLFLTPGMFGNMHLATGGKTNALLVPDTAVQTDQARKLLLVVKKDGTVAAKPVELGPLIGGLRVIRTGLLPTDRVVIVGTQFAAPGSKVETRQGTIAPVKAEPKPAIAAPLSGKATFAN